MNELLELTDDEERAIAAPKRVSSHERVVNVRRWAVDWWAWPDGSRIPSSGTEYVEAATKQEAEAILRARYPAIERLKAH